MRRSEPPEEKGVIAAINEILDQYVSRINSGDVNSWASVWTDDGILMQPNSPPIIGKERIRAQQRGFQDRFTPDLAIKNEEVRVAGGWAYARGTFFMTMTPRVGGQATSFEGDYITIFEGQADESWMISRDILNSRAPS